MFLGIYSQAVLELFESAFVGSGEIYHYLIGMYQEMDWRKREPELSEELLLLLLLSSPSFG